MLLEAEVPFTLGLFAPWGIGKTTIISEVGRLVEEKAAFVYFDVWRYEEDALRRQFLRDLARQLHPRFADFDPATELTDLDEGEETRIERLTGLNAESIRETSVRVILAGIIAFLMLRAIGSASLRDQHGTVRDFVVSAAIALLLFVVAPLSRILKGAEATLEESSSNRYRQPRSL
jgi:KAP family P-loop domain